MDAFRSGEGDKIRESVFQAVELAWQEGADVIGFGGYVHCNQQLSGCGGRQGVDYQWQLSHRCRRDCGGHAAHGRNESSRTAA